MTTIHPHGGRGKDRELHKVVDPHLRAFLEACAKADLGHKQNRMAMAVAAKLGGYSKMWDHISVQAMADFAGLNRRTAARHLQALSDNPDIPFLYRPAIGRGALSTIHLSSTGLYEEASTDEEKWTESGGNEDGKWTNSVDEPVKVDNARAENVHSEERLPRDKEISEENQQRPDSLSTSENPESKAASKEEHTDLNRLTALAAKAIPSASEPELRDTIARFLEPDGLEPPWIEHVINKCAGAEPPPQRASYLSQSLTNFSRQQGAGASHRVKDEPKAVSPYRTADPRPKADQPPPTPDAEGAARMRAMRQMLNQKVARQPVAPPVSEPKKEAVNA